MEKISTFCKQADVSKQELRLLNESITLAKCVGDPAIPMRLALCRNILRTCTDERLESLERQVDAIINQGLVVGVNIGPELPL